MEAFLTCLTYPRSALSAVLPLQGTHLRTNPVNLYKTKTDISLIPFVTPPKFDILIVIIYLKIRIQLVRTSLQVVF